MGNHCDNGLDKFEGRVHRSKVNTLVKNIIWGVYLKYTFVSSLIQNTGLQCDVMTSYDVMASQNDVSWTKGLRNIQRGGVFIVSCNCAVCYTGAQNHAKSFHTWYTYQRLVENEMFIASY